MKIMICDPTSADAIEAIRAAGHDVDVRDDISAEDLPAAIPAYHGIVVRSRTKVREPLIDVAENLKVIVRGGVGLDNIAVDYARARGIAVLNTPAASTQSVAELTVGYFFALARRIPQMTASMKAGLWEKKKFKGAEIAGKTLGLVGVGRIGTAVAERAKALGMTVIAYDPYVKEWALGELVNLDALLEQADYISMHLPHTDETHHIIDAAAIARMKEGVRIVNCARGGVIDEDALYDGITAGKVAGAALDVFAEEPCKGHKLFELDEVLGSPHVGAGTKEATDRVGAEVAEKMVGFFKEN